MTDAMGKRDLSPFFAPRSIAVVGAGERPSSSGGAVLQNLVNARFDGRIVPVNPKGGTIFGHPAVASLTDIEEPCDLAVIVIRPDLIPRAVADAAASGHTHLLILPGGFSEAGPDGEARDAEVRDLAARAGITVAGPNCAGIIHLDPARPFAATFLRDLPPGPSAKGGVAVISQSGALAEEMIAKANDRQTTGGLPISTIVSVGNAMHLGVEDYLAHLGALDDVSAVLLYIESVGDEARFAEIARSVAARKPVVALIGGRSAEGARAVKAHTGGTAKGEAAIDRFCQDCGLLRVESLRRFILAAKGFGAFPQGLGRRALILSNSGGPGVLATDRAALEGLELPALPKAMASALGAALPGEASVANPIDLLADAREDRFGLTLEAAIEHAGAFDAILGIHVVPFMVDAAPVIDRLADLAPSAPIPMMHAMMGTLPGQAEWFATMESAGVPMFNDVEAMAETAGLLARYPAIKAGLTEG